MPDDAEASAGGSDVLSEFDRQLRATRALPVLFVGSGLSKRYLSAPACDDLLDEFAQKVNSSLPYYRGKTTN